MTEQQVFDQLTDKKKWYLHGEPPLTQQSASAFVKRFKEETASQETIRRVFAQFGYKVISEVKYEKV
jgi:hypothetical protein